MARSLKPTTPLAERLIQARGVIPREELAERLGVASNTLGNWERGSRAPDCEYLSRLRLILGVSLDWLVSGEGPMRPGDVVPPATAIPPATPLAPPARRELDRDLLQALLELYLERSKAHGVELTPAQLAEAVTRLYAEAEADLVPGADGRKVAG